MRAPTKIAATDVWAAIEHLADKRGMSLSDLEKHADLPPESLSRRTQYDGKDRWPSLPTIFAILAAAGSKLPEFGEIVDTLASRL